MSNCWQKIALSVTHLPSHAYVNKYPTEYSDIRSIPIQQTTANLTTSTVVRKERKQVSRGCEAEAQLA